MPSQRKKIPSGTVKRITQESSGSCPMCGEMNPDCLDIHHITAIKDGGENSDTNLILLCRNCHGKVTSGGISHEEVVTTKQILSKQFEAELAQRGVRWQPEPPDAVINSSGDNATNIIAKQVIYKQTGKRRPKTQPVGTIGADPFMKGYIGYLVQQYQELRKKGSDYYGQSGGFHYSVIHKMIKAEFGAPTYDNLKERFDGMVVFLQSRIDETIEGKNNSRAGKANYHDYETYIRIMKGEV